MSEQRAYIRYSDGVEQRPEGEDETIDKIIASMTHESEKVAGREKHAVRASHAKASAVLKGELRVLDGLAPELRQGLFAQPRTYEAAVRMAQGPGEHLPDSVHTHRGMAIKVLGVEGAMLPDHGNSTSQDFVLATGPVFPNADAAGFLIAMKGLEAGAGTGETLKKVVAATAGALNTAVKAVTGRDVPLLDFFGHAPRHPLTDCYYSQAALRYGDHVAKIMAVPVAPAQDALSRDPLDTSENPNTFRDAAVAYFRENGAEFEIRVQLCTSLERMPVEDASVQWPEEESPYRPVARLVLPRQDAMSEARRVFFNDAMSFRPAHGLEAHRPLGSLMRARLRTYPALVAYRQKSNGNPVVEPSSLAEIPD